MRTTRTKVPVTEPTTVNGVTEDTPTGRYRTERAPLQVADRREQHTVRNGQAVMAFTALALLLSVTAIGMLLLHVHLPWFAAFPVAAVFDGLWIWSLHTEWLADTNRRARIGAQIAGLAFMAVSAFAIWVEGGVLHAPLGATAVAASVPLAVKGAWLLRFLLVAPRLSRALSTRLEKELGEKAVEYRVKEAELQALALDRKIVAAKLALESVEILTVEQEFPDGTGAETAVEQLAVGAQRETDRLARQNRKLRKKLKRLSQAQPTAQLAQSVQPVLSLAQPMAQPSGQRVEPTAQPVAQPFGFTAQPSAQVAERLSRVAQTAELLAAQADLTGAQLAKELGVSLASAKRYLSEARKATGK